MKPNKFSALILFLGLLLAAPAASGIGGCFNRFSIYFLARELSEPANVRAGRIERILSDALEILQKEAFGLDLGRLGRRLYGLTPPSRAQLLNALGVRDTARAARLVSEILGTDGNLFPRNARTEPVLVRPAARKLPGLFYAVTDAGNEEPVIDLYYPEFVPNARRWGMFTGLVDRVHPAGRRFQERLAAIDADSERLFEEMVARIQEPPPHGAIRLGGSADPMTPINALLKLRQRDHAGLCEPLENRPVVLVVTGQEDSAASFGARAVRALRQPGGPLERINVSVEFVWTARP